MKRVLSILLMLVCLITSTTCFATKFTVDTDRWVHITDTKNASFYQDFRSIETDKTLKTVTVWIMAYDELGDRATLFNIKYNYRNRTYSIIGNIIKKISDGTIVYSDTPIYAKEQLIPPESLYESMYNINKSFLEEPVFKEHKYNIKGTGIVFTFPSSFGTPIERNAVLNSEPESFLYDYKEFFTDPTVKMITAHREFPIMLVLSTVKHENNDLLEVKEIATDKNYKNHEFVRNLTSAYASNKDVTAINIDRINTNKSVFLIMDIIFDKQGQSFSMRHYITIKQNTLFDLNFSTLDIAYKPQVESLAKEIIANINY